uniref:ZP domain-containing protein n=1 Tax=Strongyloides papillosus TaxID=174720 RepID=A0A0N5BS21_STREA
MKILWTILLLYTFVTLLYGNCNVQKAFTLQGEKTFNGTDNVTCPNKDDKCATIVGYIPELFNGQNQDCSSNIFDFITQQLYVIRPDLKIEFDSKKFLDDAKKNCSNNLSSSIFGKLLPGNYSMFISCSNSGTDPSTEGAPDIPPVSSTKPLATCHNGNGSKVLCKEGYCTFYEYSINNTEDFSTASGSFYGCPNQLYDSMSTLLLTDNKSGANYDDLQKVSNFCVQKKNNTLKGTSQKYQYFYYINCNIDGNIVIKDIPQLPPGIVSSKSKVCPSETSGYFVNMTTKSENKTINCNEGYCAYVKARVLNVDGVFQGCPSSIENVINEINNQTKGVLNNTLSDFINKCNNKTYKKVDIVKVVDIYMDCYDGDHPDMSGNNSSIIKFSFLSFLIVVFYFFVHFI